MTGHAMAERLRASSADLARRGAAAGRKWAAEVATEGQLRAVEGAAAGSARELFLVLNPGEDPDDVRPPAVRRWWREVAGLDDVPDSLFAAAFAGGARAAWGEVRGAVENRARLDRLFENVKRSVAATRRAGRRRASA